MGSTATYMTAWALLQCASLVLPARAASRLERRLYSSYQAMVGFWFETWSGVEVGGARGGANYTGMLLGEQERAHLVILLEPPSVCLYIYIYSSGYEAFLVPTAPRATGKRIASSITSGYLENCDGERAEPHYMPKLCVTSKPWLLYCVSKVHVISKPWLVYCVS